MSVKKIKPQYTDTIVLHDNFGPVTRYFYKDMKQIAAVAEKESAAIGVRLSVLYGARCLEWGETIPKMEDRIILKDDLGSDGSVPIHVYTENKPAKGTTQIVFNVTTSTTVRCMFSSYHYYFVYDYTTHTVQMLGRSIMGMDTNPPTYFYIK